MGKTYKASITVACLKEHTCVGCGGKFAYEFTRKVQGEAASEEQALLKAQEAANKAAENEVDLHACPNCGMVQPEMIAHERSARYWLGVAVAFVGVLVALILGLTDVITIATSAYIATGVMGLVFLWSLMATFYNPNKDLEANRMASQAKVTEKSGERWDNPEGPIGGLAFAHWLGLMFLLAAVLIAILPVALAGISGWTQNATTTPAVCGPGDSPCIYFDEKISAVNSKWKGQVIAVVTNGGELGMENPILQGETKKSDWGDTISGKSVSNSSRTMWATVNLPADAELAGKTLKLTIIVDAIYPFMVGNGFNEEEKIFKHDTELTLSSPNAGKTYKSTWWIGQILVIVLSIAGAAVLVGTCTALKNQANPTSISPLGEVDETESE
jgi:hypothetical protein